MDERRVADYFVIAGLPEDLDVLDDEALPDVGHLKDTHDQAPITDIGIIFPELNEQPPPEYKVIKLTPTGLNADLNHGSLRSQECYLCYRRGRDRPPLVDIGVMYEGREWLMKDAEVIKESVGGHVANVNNSNAITYITYRRGQTTMPCNALVVTDICVVIASKGESPPHAFCCINKNLNKGIVGSDVFLCYKKSMNQPKSLTYKPQVMCRYPLTDHESFPFPSNVSLFCLPMGATIELWPKEACQSRPVFSTFVLTVSDAKHKVYGSAVTFYETINPDRLSEKQTKLLGYDRDGDYNVHLNRSICVLSHWPFSDTFEKWLMFLYNMVASGEPQSVPIERYVVQLLDEAPFPTPRTLLDLTPDNYNRIFFTQPEELPLPRSAARFSKLLLSLGSENSLKLLLLALTEQKILIHSLRPDTLTAVGEAVSSLLFPFKWQCPYIPLCPLGLVEVLHAPLPFLIGVDSRYFDLYDPPTDVSYVDLDTNSVTVCDALRPILSIKLLPKRAAKMLKVTLDKIYNKLQESPTTYISTSEPDLEASFQEFRKESAYELEIQEAFLKFMVMTLKGYRNFLLPIIKAPTVGTTDPQALFKLNDFLKSRDKAHHKFFQLLMHTQMFIRFIEERSFVTDGDQGLAFFDECMERLGEEETKVKLLEFDVSHSSERTVLLLAPEPLSDDAAYIYKEFTLNPMLLSCKKLKQIKSLHQSVAPGSPMARRTKHEIKSAQKLARKSIKKPEMWAQCLSGTCHTLYFMVLPSLLSLNNGKEHIVLEEAYRLLDKASRQRLANDEVCYRLMMQLCGEHSKPLLAVKLLLLMKRSGLQPNALTYGLYNRCVLEAEWPAQVSSSKLLWNKLSYVVMGAAHFKWAGKTKAARRKASTEGGSSLLDQNDRTASRSSLDSHDTEPGFFDKISRVVNIVKGVNNNNNNSSEQSVVDAIGSIEVLQGQSECEEVEAENSNKDQGINVNFNKPESPSEYSRLLSRSESAGDANIIDKLQQNQLKKSCSRALHFNGETEQNDNENKTSPSKISPRTLITENDPLGAFEQPPPETCITPPPEEVPASQPVLATDEPILFRNSVQRSSTFEGSPPAQSKIHRSETVPAATVASSLASLGTSFRNINFSRYSPARLSAIRKADLKVPQQFIEQAIYNLSPSSLTGKKSNELIQGGISSVKSVTQKVAKKFDEIKEAISTSTNSTPVKVIAGDRLGAGDVLEGIGEAESTDGSEPGDRQRKISAELGSYRGSYANLKDFEEIPDNIYPTNDIIPDSELDISLTSCSQCHNCSSLVYDEEIMAGWSHEDSNLNTMCSVCNKATVPFLTITISQKGNQVCDPFSVPYLNPLVLRKELENVLTQEGDLSLSEAKFVEEHPIIYWNLVWAFERINVQTHLPNLYLKLRAGNRNVNSSGESINHIDGKNGHSSGGVSRSNTDENISSMQPVEDGADPLTQELVTQAPINVRCMWDDPKLHGDNLPLYALWQKGDSYIGDQNNTTRLMQSIISSVCANDVSEPMKKLAIERQKVQQNDEGTTTVGYCTQSIYRDILFLTCKAKEKAKCDLNVFDKEYASAYSRAQERHNKLYSPQDRPISYAAIYCRQYFKPLSLP